jgi:hypothetical protein
MKKKGRPDCPAESLEGLQVRPGQGDHAAWMFESSAWSEEPLIPEIIASPMRVASETI